MKDGPKVFCFSKIISQLLQILVSIKPLKFFTLCRLALFCRDLRVFRKNVVSEGSSYLEQSDGHSSSRLWPPVLCHRRPGRWISHVMPEGASRSLKLSCLRWLLVGRVSQPTSGSLFLDPHYTPQPLLLQCRVWWSSIYTCQARWYHTPGSPRCPPPHTHWCPGTPPPLYDWSAHLEEAEDTMANVCGYNVCGSIK